jgi:hypothetical protein
LVGWLIPPETMVTPFGLVSFTTPSLMLERQNEDGVAMPLLTISSSTTFDCLR